MLYTAVTIPSELGAFTALLHFGFTDAEFSGTIPAELTAWTQATAMNVGNSHLCGWVLLVPPLLLLSCLSPDSHILTSETFVAALVLIFLLPTL